eukprot:238986-Rhodomonas_salina.1
MGLYTYNQVLPSTRRAEPGKHDIDNDRVIPDSDLGIELWNSQDIQRKPMLGILELTSSSSRREAITPGLQGVRPTRDDDLL